MPFDVERLLRLWTEPLPEDDAAAAESFRALYTDPVQVNGASLPVADLVARARRTRAGLADLAPEVLAVADAGTAVAVVFRLTGRHVGPLDTPAGPLPATGARIELRVIDVLTIPEGRISAVWMVADWLPVVAAAGLVHMDGWRLALAVVVPEPPEGLFPLLVLPDELARWWGPHGFATREVEFDATVGSGYRLTVQPSEGDAFHVTGEVLAVDRPRRLSYTFRYEEPGPDDRETVVVLTLAAVDDGTEVSVSQGPFSTEERRELHRRGWAESLERLRAVVQEGRAG